MQVCSCLIIHLLQNPVYLLKFFFEELVLMHFFCQRVSTTATSSSVYVVCMFVVTCEFLYARVYVCDACIYGCIECMCTNAYACKHKCVCVCIHVV